MGTPSTAVSASNSTDDHSLTVSAVDVLVDQSVSVHGEESDEFLHSEHSRTRLGSGLKCGCSDTCWVKPHAPRKVAARRPHAAQCAWTAAWAALGVT